MFDSNGIVKSKKVNKNFSRRSRDSRPNPGEESGKHEPNRQPAQLSRKSHKNTFAVDQSISLDFHIHDKLQGDPQNGPPNDSHAKIRGQMRP